MFCRKTRGYNDSFGVFFILFYFFFPLRKNFSVLLSGLESCLLVHVHLIQPQGCHLDAVGTFLICLIVVIHGLFDSWHLAFIFVVTLILHCNASLNLFSLDASDTFIIFCTFFLQLRVIKVPH